MGSWQASAEAGGDELLERARAVADGVLRRRLHLAERDGVSVRDEHRIVTEAVIAARRPHQRAVRFATKAFLMAVGPCEREHGDEAGAAIPIALRRLARKVVLDFAHR